MAYQAYDISRNKRWMLGLSTDPRPILPVGEATTTLMETDTGDRFRWTGTKWLPEGNLVDPVTKATVTIDRLHKLTHDGNVFHAATKVIGLANGATLDVLLKITGFRNVHIQYLQTILGDGDADIQVFEAPTLVGPGIAVPFFNTNRASTLVASSTLETGIGLTTGGTEITNAWIPPTAGTGQNGAGAGGELGEEWVLRFFQNYVMRLTNNSGGAEDVHISLLLFEE